VVLGQFASSATGAFNLVLAEGLTLTNVELSVLVRPVVGDVSDGGGVVWRATTERWYAAQIVPKRGALRVERMERGVSTLIGEVAIHAEDDRWYALGARMIGDRIECTFEGRLTVSVRDAAIEDEGGVGLITEADARTHFDDLVISEP
jgi:hypothetical protein